MQIHRGIAVSRGVAIGPAFVLGAEEFRIPLRYVSRNAVESEIERFRHACTSVAEELKRNSELITQQMGDQYGAIFSAHLSLLNDPKLTREIEELIRKNCSSPEFAVKTVLGDYARRFRKLGEGYFAERALDINDLERKLLQQLLGESRTELSNLIEPVLVLARNLTPSETASLNPKFVLGFATETGAKTSHTAILAGALGIPAVLGIGRFLSNLEGGETVIIDGNHGEVIVDPDPPTLERYTRSQDEFRAFTDRLRSLKSLPSETKDGQSIKLFANIEFPDEVSICLDRGAEGIGLYRTEFLYLGQNREPTEEDHYEAYCEVIKAMGNRPVVIRTMDLGAEKLPVQMRHLVAETQNPYLGLRSTRLCLKFQALFKTQLRAILRAAVHGNVLLMFPLVSTLIELRQARMILRDVEEDLRHDKLPYGHNLRVGMMVEVPSAAILASEFAPLVDFFSIGTNDLIQYTLAADRGNPDVAYLYSSSDRAIIRLISMVIQAARAHNVEVTVCGQMSSDPIYTPLLMGLGIRQLSVAPSVIPEVKEVVRSLTIPRAEEITRIALQRDMARDVENYLMEEYRKLFPSRDVW